MSPPAMHRPERSKDRVRHRVHHHVPIRMRHRPPFTLDPHPPHHQRQAGLETVQVVAVADAMGGAGAGHSRKR